MGKVRRETHLPWLVQIKLPLSTNTYVQKAKMKDNMKKYSSIEIFLLIFVIFSYFICSFAMSFRVMFVLEI